MDPVVVAALIGAGVSLVSALALLHSNRQLQHDNQRAREATGVLEGVKETVDSWRELDTAHRAEIARLQDENRRLREQLAAGGQ